MNFQNTEDVNSALGAICSAAANEYADLYNRCSDKEEFLTERVRIKEKYDAMIRDASDEIIKKYYERSATKLAAASRASELSKLAKGWAYLTVHIAYMKGVLIDKKNPDEWYGAFLSNPVFRREWAPADADSYDPETGSFELAEKALAGDAWVREEFEELLKPDGTETKRDFLDTFRYYEKAITKSPEMDPGNPSNAVLKELGNPKKIIADVQKEALEMVREAKRLL